MSQLEDSVVDERFKQLEDIARDVCDGTTYSIEGSSASGHFLVHKEANDLALLRCERDGSVITLTVSVYPPDGVRVIYSHPYIATERGLQHPIHESILMSPKADMNSAFASFEGSLRAS
jgi:hypothetical protein